MYVKLLSCEIKLVPEEIDSDIELKR